MQTKFIHDNFELDVSDIELNWTEENTWFKDEFFLMSSFPFELEYSQVPYFQQFQHQNLAHPEVYFQGKLQKDGRIEEAILEVEEADEKLRATIRYGIEALPNWNKNISELELEVVLPDGGDMREHADTIIPLTYPEVNYNFPAIHTDFYEDAVLMADFQGTINKRYRWAGGFLKNETVEDIPINKNIVYPFPYHLYVLKAVVEDAGYILKGDILEDPDLKDAVIVPGKPLTEFEDLPESIVWNIGETDIFRREGFFYIYQAELEINHRAMFRMLGELNGRVMHAKIKLNGSVIYTFNEGMPRNIDLRFRRISEENLLEFEAFRIVGGGQTAAEFEIRVVHLLDELGNQIPILANFSNVHLADKLPDMSVGDFIKFHKRLKNYDFDIRNNNEIWMNLIQNEVQTSEIVDISEFEPLQVKRKYDQAKSFVLQYDGEYEDYEFTKVFIDQSGFKINDFKKKEDTTEININGIPLPISKRSTIVSATQISDDSTKLMLAKYSGLVDNYNESRPMDDLDCEQLYFNHWQRWINFMIHSVRFVWQVKEHPNLLMKIKRKSKLFSFNNLMFVYSLNRRRKKDVEEIDIEAYSTKI